jgi:GAF domain-containing protein
MNTDSQSPTHQDLADLIASVAATLEATSNPTETRDAIVRQAVVAVPGVEFASISVTHTHGLNETVSATSELAVTCDALQTEAGEGPCLDAGRQRATFMTGDIAADPRWPVYGPAAAKAGVMSQLATEIFTSGRSMMALNLYSTRPNAFADSVPTAELVTSQAVAAIGFADTVDQHDQAMQTRGTIGQAIGIVMERYGMNEVRAFAFLQRVSSHSNVKIRHVADEIVDDANKTYGGPTA